MKRTVALVWILAVFYGGNAQSTPVIGGNCKIGMADVQIGGKQTQFFLKCEAASDSPEGEGVWVVKSRAASPPASVTQDNVQYRPTKKPTNPNICEQDNGAREADSCAVSAMCLQADQNNPVNYLQCDQTTMRWVKKACQDTFVFNFEQQTCIVPRKNTNLHSQNLSSPIPPSNSSSSFDCSKCPLGTVCEDGQCTPAHSSTLCADGSAPLGACPCTGGTECTAQGVCCAIGRVCVRCSNAKPCPQPLTCSLSGCCEPRKHRHPSNTLLPFVSPADIFDVAILQGPAPGFRVMAVNSPVKNMKLSTEETTESTPNDTSVAFAAVSSARESARSANVSYESSFGAASLGGSSTCMGNADCSASSECPSSFICEMNCCRLSVCPGGDAVRFACSTAYQCGATEKCMFGGCCGTRKEESVEKNPYESVGEESLEPLTPIPTTMKPIRPTSMMPSFGPSDVCEVDPRVSNCSISSPCPESSECMFGVCCRVPMARCGSGLLALSLPESCRMDDDCPIASRCEYGRCCPLENAEITRNDEPPPVILKTTLEPPVVKKPRCLQSPRCSSMTLCPPRFTCSLDGRCCRLDVLCPDGTVPEDSCDENHLCPSSAQSCVKIGTQKVCCAMGQYPAGGIVMANPPSGLSCTYSACSNSNPCSVGTCNSGYCCSSGSNSAPAIIVANPSSGGCNGCGSQSPVIISTCPGGGYPVGQCNSGYCSPGYSCVSGGCCPTYSAPAPSVQIYTCPGGGSAVGACISGACATGYSCVSGGCCPSATTQNPFVCPDGTQAVGGCVSGKCGTGYTCSNGLCCSGTSTSVRCLDGSEAVGACIPSCQGNACGGSQLTYYCGSGYTCTTGNICCPVNSCPNGGTPLGPTVNGLCPTGYTAQNGICCSATCPDGSASQPAVNGLCPAGLTLTNGVCCAGAAGVPVGICDDAFLVAIGPCTTAGACGGQVGYACDTTNQQCCPAFDWTNRDNQIGPAFNGLCPMGHVIVYVPNQLDENGENPGYCYPITLIAGVCAEDQQNGPCVNGECNNGQVCNVVADVCCPAAAFRRIRPTQKAGRPQMPSYGRPLASYMPPRGLTCPDGSAANGGCMNGLCGLGLECQNGLCCAPNQQKQNSLSSQCPNGQLAVSGCFADGSCGTGFECVKRVNLCCPPGGNEPAVVPSSAKSTIRPIGASCFVDDECVGASEGLSLCHAGVCQCSPIAYSQGIACVRRKALRMNDSPVDTAVEKNEVTKTV